MLMPLAACALVIAVAYPGAPPPQASPPSVSGTKAAPAPRQKPGTVPEGTSKAPSGDEKPNPGPPSKRRNVSIEVTIADQSRTAEPVRKVVSMVVADGLTGSVRTGGVIQVRTSEHTTQAVPVTLNVDASPVLDKDGSVRLSMSLEYRPTAGGSADEGEGTAVTERVSVTLDSGKPLVISRAVDPSGNRKVTVEVTATVLK